MNLPNKITVSRIILAILILVLLIFPWYQVGFEFPKYTISKNIVIDLKYIIAAGMFIIPLVLILLMAILLVKII